MKCAARTRGAPAKPLDRRKPSLRNRQDRLLTDGQRVFIGRFLIHHNATRAYREALTLPGFDVHQNFDNVLMNGERNGEGNGTESAIHGRVQA